jgi:hypothetical protein
MLLMKPEKPDFLRITLGFVSFVSSEYLFGEISWFSPMRGGCFSPILSPAEKLADCRSGGLCMRGSGDVCAKGGGGGRRREFWYPEAFVESNWFRMELPSNGAPTNSCEVFSLRGRVEFTFALAPPEPGGGALNSELARTGEGPDIWRSSEEFDDAYTAAFGEVVLRVWP